MEKFYSIDTRSSLLGRVKNPDDQDSWQTFFDIYGFLIRSQAIKAGLTEVEVKEVTQETLIEVSERIQSFEYDRRKGTFKAWLYQLTRWRIANHFQKRRRGTVPVEQFSLDGDDLRLEEALLTNDSDESWEREWRQALFEAALNKLRAELPPKQFQVFDCLMTKHWSVTQVTEALRISRAHVYLLKFRAVAAFKREIRRLQKRPNRASRAMF